MLSDLITDLIRAKTPKEKEAAYRRLEKLGVDRFTADVAAEELRKEVYRHCSKLDTNKYSYI